MAVVPVTVSERGIKAIQCASVPGLIGEVLNHSRPIHSRRGSSLGKDGKQTHAIVPYSSNGEVLKSKMCKSNLTFSLYLAKHKHEKPHLARPVELH